MGMTVLVRKVATCEIVFGIDTKKKEPVGLLSFDLLISDVMQDLSMFEG